MKRGEQTRLHKFCRKWLNCALSARLRLNAKISDEYRDYKQLPAALLAQQGAVGPARPKQDRKMITAGRMSLCIVFNRHKFDMSCLTISIHGSPENARNDRYDTRTNAIDAFISRKSFKSTHSTQNNTRDQAYLSSAMEADASHLWALGMGPFRCCRTWKQVVCLWCG